MIKYLNSEISPTTWAPWKIPRSPYCQQFLFRNFFRIVGVFKGKSFVGIFPDFTWAKSTLRDRRARQLWMILGKVPKKSMELIVLVACMCVHLAIWPEIWHMSGICMVMLKQMCMIFFGGECHPCFLDRLNMHLRHTVARRYKLIITSKGILENLRGDPILS